MRKTMILAALLCSAVVLSAQTTLEEVLRSVEMNNKELQAGFNDFQAQSLDVKSQNNLKNPSLSYSHVFGNKPGLGESGEFTASQSFDFPSAYVQRHKHAKEMGIAFDLQYKELRRQILLQTKQTCLDLVYLNRQRQLLNQRFSNAKHLSDIYATRLQNGDANILETNKIDLEMLNVETEVRKNKIDMQNKLNELAVLNGGIPIAFTDTVFLTEAPLLPLPQLLEEVKAANPDLLAKQSQKLASALALKAVRSEGLPEIEVGYKMTHAKGGERFNGFLVGISVPLFANKNKVKSAKAVTRQSEYTYDNTLTSIENQLSSLYNEALSLQESAKLYNGLLERQSTITVLNEALEAGHISMTEYFVDTTAYYQSMENYLQILNDYHKTLSKIYDYRL